MKQQSKMHRPSAVLAAVLMLLHQALYVAAALSVSGTYNSPVSMTQLLGNSLIVIALSVVLFRGGKDMAAGVVLLATIAMPVFSVGYNLVILFFSNGSIPYTSVCIISGLILAAFRGLLAGECLSQGKISASGGRVFLWFLPILCFALELWIRILQHRYLYNEPYTGDILTSDLIFLSLQWLGPVLMGVSFSVPEKRKEC